MNGVNTQQFHDDLADLADLAKPVDLRDRVLQGSRRQSRHRAVAVSLAAVAVVAAGGVTFAVASEPNGYVGPGTTPVPTVTGAPTPGPTASATPDRPVTTGTPGTPGTSNSAAKFTLGPWSESGGKSSLPGTLYYLTGGPTGPFKINVLADDKLRTASLRGTLVQNDCVRQSIVFSPDGSSVAWVESDEPASDLGALVVASLDGGGSRVVLPSGVACRSGAGPKWMPDSRRLVVARSNDARIVDVNTGATTAAPLAWRDYLAFSRNGAYVAYGEQGRIVTTTAAGKVVKRVPYDINCCTGGFTVQSISDDGRYVGVSFHNSDPGTVRNAMKIVDMTTGKNVDLGMTGPDGVSIKILLVGADRLFATAITDTSTDVTLDSPGKDDVSIPVTGRLEFGTYRP
ncbi:TolB family protein [Asanoa iriomotensis]|uniref:WD40 repeat protein n=1 Tax=Asanoa iriomotensis TaxID=234613 RepID=A0ABQ4CFS4_9ACTN|nr:hypothetical protein [Asanoa iriomotensis]GIF61624.1 hypothetical protein Air01nite_77190 [Asanoa iriomotensis]